MKKTIILLQILLLVSACSLRTNKDTLYPYQFNDNSKPIKTVLIADINAGVPSRHYLSRYEAGLDDETSQFLSKRGYNLLSSRLFSSIWHKTKQNYGSIFNPNTGKMTVGFEKALASTLNKLFTQQPQLDAVIFTDLIESRIQFGSGGKKTAMWDGVQRKIKVQGVGEAFKTDYNWLKNISGLSIAITVIDRDLNIVQHSVGGIQIAHAIEVRNKTGEFVRRKNLLRNKKEIKQGLELAFHPWINMKSYPAKD